MTSLTQSDIIFPPASTAFKDQLNEIKRSRASITNRLSSITQDARFVCTVADTLDLPLVANERCGSWYVPTKRKAGSVYFKSTDGHFGNWGFSLRRLNLHVLDLVGERDGYVRILLFCDRAVEIIPPCTLLGPFFSSTGLFFYLTKVILYVVITGKNADDGVKMYHCGFNQTREKHVEP